MTGQPESDPQPEQTVRLGHILVPEQAEEITGLKIAPEIFQMVPTGNLILVVVEPQPRSYGMIEIPDSVYKAPVGCGYIIGVGPYAGDENFALRATVGAIGIISQLPSDLLGAHVLFGQHTGVPIRTNMLEKKYEIEDGGGQVLIMTSRDIQVIDLNPEPLVKRVQAKIDQEGESSLIVEV